MSNEKRRHNDSSKYLKEAFADTVYYSDIQDASSLEPFIVSSTKAFYIKFSRKFNEEQRKQIEKLLWKWLHVGENFPHQGIVCWREGSAILSVF